MDDKYIKQITSVVIIAVLVVLSYLLLKPILMSIITGIVLAFIFYPIYSKIHKRFKNKNIPALIISLFLILIVIIPTWFLTPILLDESINIFRMSQNLDLITPLQDLFPTLFSSQEFSAEIGRTIHSFITGLTTSAMNMISKLLLNFPTLLLQLMIALFTFFFVLRDNEDFVNYIKTLLPFPKRTEQKLFNSSKNITFSILYGQILVGIGQGLLAGISFLIFGIDNALFLTILAAVAGVFPVIGSSIIWMPVAIYAFIQGKIIAAIGVTLFGLLASFLENSLKPMFVSKMTNVHPGLILVGMVGGIFLFGVLGFILGPLILSYLLIVLETFQNKNLPGLVFTRKD